MMLRTKSVLQSIGGGAFSPASPQAGGATTKHAGARIIMPDFCEKDALKHYRALKHKFETEIRTVPTAKVKRRERFIWQGEKKVIEQARKLNREHNAYFGVNERYHFGGKADHVKYWNGFYIDFEGADHSKEFKNAAYTLALSIQRELLASGINAVMSDSGNGYHLSVFLEPPLLVGLYEDFATQEIRKRILLALARIKAWAETKKTGNCQADTSVYDLPRIQRIVGSWNHKAKQLSYWLNEPKSTENEKLFAWIETLPQAKLEEPETEKNYGTLPPTACAFCDYCFSHKLPDGTGRNERVAPSVSAFTRNHPGKEKLRAAYNKVQNNDDIDRLALWDETPSEFWCGQLRHYGKENGLGKICDECLEDCI